MPNSSLPGIWCPSVMSIRMCSTLVRITRPVIDQVMATGDRLERTIEIRRIHLFECDKQITDHEAFS